MRFQLGRERGPNWWIWLVAILVHVPVALVVVAVAWRETSVLWHPRGVIGATSPRVVPNIRFAMRPPRQVPATPSPAQVAKRAPRPLPETRDLRPAVRQRTVDPTPLPAGMPVVGLPDPPPGGAAAAPLTGTTGTVIPPIAPAYGSGVLWGRAPKATAEQLAQRLLGTASGDRLDSLTIARLQQWIDSLATEANARKPPSLVTTIGGKKVGVDGQWIYLGPIKIPSAILALLPINIQANPTQSEYNKRLNVMREDLYIAAQRAQNYAEFKSAVDKLRAEKQAEKEFRDNQRGGGKPEGERQ